MGEFLMSETYKQSLTESMIYLAKERDFMFIGQGTIDGGHGMSATIPDEISSNCIELPVFEETQTGIALGMAIDGLKIVSIYPRFDFFISGMNQLVNHVDKTFQMSAGKFDPHIIFRVGVGAKTPIDAGPQHTNNYSQPFKSILTNVQIIEISKDDLPSKIYREAASRTGLYLIVEHFEHYEAQICGG